ncbi:MAG: hypothetical protein ISS52_00295 [Dehalococcoidia bacterium]|nr:hypothetical protein [Dehalococcoidia bacterium]
MDEVAAKVLKDFLGFTDEDLAKVPRHIERIARNFPRALPYKIVAEVTSSKYCFAGIKVGDKIVFDPWLSLDQTTCTPCPRALIPVLVALASYWERTIEFLDRGIEGIDDLDDVIFGRAIACLDPGLEHGGLGHVTFKFHLEKVG